MLISVVRFFVVVVTSVILVEGGFFIVAMTHISKVHQCLWDGDDYIHLCRDLHNKQSE